MAETQTNKKVPKRPLGANGPLVSAVGLGTAVLGGNYGKVDEEAYMDTLSYAANRGVTFWDSSLHYPGSEVIIGKWFAKTNRRSEVFLATKFGAFDPDAPPIDGKPDLTANSKPSFIRRALATSLSRLQTDYIDLYYQHRVDPKVPIEVVMEALREPVLKGTVRWIGLCNCSADHVRRAKSDPVIGSKVVACQVEFSPFELSIEKSGLAKACEDLGVSIVPFSPLAKGMVTGRYRSVDDFAPGDVRPLRVSIFSKENLPKNLALVDALIEMAKKYNISSSQLTLAWIMQAHPSFVPIPATRSIDRIEENAHSAEVDIDPEDLEKISKLVESTNVAGNMNVAPFELAQDSIPLDKYEKDQD